jgi:ACS family tartrate transporter-like MFS transporter
MPVTDALASSTRRIVDARVLSLLTIGIFIAFLDRVNVSFAALRMNDDLHFTPQIFGTGVSALYLGYAVFEVPSAYVLAKVGAPIWLAVMLIAWGLASAAMALVREPALFYGLRFLLGLAEAGYPAGCAYCIAVWYPPAQRGRAMSKWISGALAGTVIAAPLSTALLGLGVGGLSGWQWMFIIEGIPAFVLAALCFHNLGGGPAAAPWLPAENRRWLLDAIGNQGGEAHVVGFGGALRSPAVWIYCLVFLLLNAGGQTMIFWLPQVIKAEFAGLSTSQIGLIGGLPFLCSIATAMIADRSTTRTGDRRWHLFAMPVFTAFFLVTASLSGNKPLLIAALGTAVCCQFTGMIVLFTLPLTILGGTAAASGIALINSGGQVGGMIGPYTMGVLTTRTGSFDAGIYAATIFFLLAGLTPLLLPRLFPRAPVAIAL